MLVDKNIRKIIFADVRGWLRMIDFKNESVIRLTEAAEMLRVKYGTVHRWAKYGVSGRKLDSAFLGGTAYTSLEALNRFSGQQPSEAPPPPAKDYQDAMRDLARRGAKTSGDRLGWQARQKVSA
jgi:hypothetical protein